MKKIDHLLFFVKMLYKDEKPLKPNKKKKEENKMLIC